MTVAGPWEVSFDPKRGGPGKVTFTDLSDWTDQSDPGIKYYSGTAVYRKTVTLSDFRLPTSDSRLYLDLGLVRELAEVRVNGQPCGIVWASPFRADITKAAKAGTNELEVRVVNFWYNRVFGDQALPTEKRLTRTNIKTLQNPGTPLMPSGLLGPVTVMSDGR